MFETLRRYTQNSQQAKIIISARSQENAALSPEDLGPAMLSYLTHRASGPAMFSFFTCRASGPAMLSYLTWCWHYRSSAGGSCKLLCVICVFLCAAHVSADRERKAETKTWGQRDRDRDRDREGDRETGRDGERWRQTETVRKRDRDKGTETEGGQRGRQRETHTPGDREGGRRQRKMCCIPKDFIPNFEAVLNVSKTFHL